MLILLEEIQSKFGAILPDFLNEILERLHPKLINGSYKIHAWTFELLAISHYALEVGLELLGEVGRIEDKGEVLEMFIKGIADCSVKVDTPETFMVDFLHLFVESH
jgi:hypothetical protein